MADLDKIKYGCGTILAVMIVGLILMVRHYKQPETQEDLDRKTQKEVKAAVRELGPRFDEALRFLVAQNYDKAFCVYDYARSGLDRFPPAFQADSRQTIQEWLGQREAAWRAAVNAEFDRQFKQLDADPVTVSERLDALAAKHTDYRELQAKFDIRKADILKQLVASAPKTVYIEAEDVSTEGPSMNAQCGTMLLDAIRSKWGTGAGYRLVFRSPRWPEERGKAFLIVHLNIWISRADYVGQIGQFADKAIPERIRADFRIFKPAALSTWDNLKTIEVFQKAPTGLPHASDVRDMADEREEQLKKEFQKQLQALPPFKPGPES